MRLASRSLTHQYIYVKLRTCEDQFLPSPILALCCICTIYTINSTFLYDSGSVRVLFLTDSRPFFICYWETDILIIRKKFGRIFFKLLTLLLSILLKFQVLFLHCSDFLKFFPFFSVFIYILFFTISAFQLNFFFWCNI